MAESVFGSKPIVLSLPYQETLRSSLPSRGPDLGFTVIIAAANQEIAQAFATHKTFWLNDLPTKNNVNGFAVQPNTMTLMEQKHWQQIAPTTIVHDAEIPRFATDDWPFLYVRDKLIPQLSIRSMVVLGLLGVAMVYFFLPKEGGRMWIDSRMFFLGAAFMLLETKAVVQLALLFGSTWLVNSLVFFVALILILLANLYVLKRPPARLAWQYAGLLGILALTTVVPVDIFLSGGMLWRYVVPCLLALGPMFFAGVIFAQSFRDVSNPDMAFGSNIAGSVVGGLSESFSMLLGFRYLLLLAIIFYLLSIPCKGRAFAISKAIR